MDEQIVDVVEEVVEPQVDEVIEIVEDTEIVEPTETVDEGQVDEVVITEETSKSQSEDKTNPANAKFAELRRAKEAKDKIDAMYAQMAKDAGIEGITNAEEYAQAVKKEQDRLRIEREQQKFLDAYKKDNDPKHLLDAQAVAMQSYINPVQQKEVVKQQAQATIEAEIKAYNEEFGGDLKSIDDIATLPNSTTIIEKMELGLTLSEANYLANRATIDSSRQAAIKQEAINQAKGLGHIKANGVAGKINPIQVTRSEIAEAKKWFPHYTDQQAAKYVRESKKSGDM